MIKQRIDESGDESIHDPLPSRVALLASSEVRTRRVAAQGLAGCSGWTMETAIL